jgi:hypothetical protein
VPDRTLGRAIWVILIATAACASSSETGTQSRSHDTIGQAELSGLENLSTFDAVRRLRPNWLRARGQDSFRSAQTARVYLNGALFGEIGSLRNISVRTVTRIDFLDAREATLRFGTDHSAGALLVSTSG